MTVAQDGDGRKGPTAPEQELRTAPLSPRLPNSGAGRANKMYDEWLGAGDGAHRDVD